MGNLYKELKEYEQSDFYPFHMPGHKRHMQTMPMNHSYQIDITEIDGFDNLHHAEGVLQLAMQRAAKLYQSDETYFLVNGSTGGILSAISAVVGKRGKLLLARNSHKSAFNAVLLRELEPIFIYPELEEEFSISGGIRSEDVADALAKHSDIQAVFITSPTYDGIVSDVESIAKIVHDRGIPLIVDEAHGAHFGFHPFFPQNSVHCKADIVIHSVHKTLPALTQSALLHVNGEIVDRGKLHKYLSIYQTSSPSYVLMASVDECISILEKGRELLFTQLQDNLEEFHRASHVLKNIRILGQEVIGHAGIKDIDKGKIVISVKDTTINGQQMNQILLREYHLQMEMAAPDYVLAIVTIMDTREGLHRLSGALMEIDKKIKKNLNPVDTGNLLENHMGFMKNTELKRRLYETQDGETEQVLLLESRSRVSCEFVYLYPPGIPILVPGEVIQDTFLALILNYRQQGFSIFGPVDDSLQTIRVIKELFYN